MVKAYRYKTRQQLIVVVNYNILEHILRTWHMV